MVTGRVAIVTGGSRGLGRRISIELAGKGLNVAIVSRTIEDMAETVALIADAGGSAMYVKADVSDPGDVTNLLRAVEFKFGLPEVLVNNAAVVGPVKDLKDVTDEELEDCLATNFKSMLMMVRAVVPGMIQRRSGSIVNITSGLADIPMNRLGVYSITKAAVNQFTRVLASELLPYKIRVNAIDPGLMDTAMQAKMREMDILEAGPEIYRTFHEFKSAGLLKDPSEAAKLVVFLTSDESVNITGEVGDAYHYEILGYRLAA